jgi:hypothetical protein
MESCIDLSRKLIEIGGEAYLARAILLACDDVMTRRVPPDVQPPDRPA